MHAIAPDDIQDLKPNQIFVYGSNLSGEHNSGTAKKALDWGAVNGIGIGISGMTYGIPTKGIKPTPDSERPTLPLKQIKKYVSQFIAYAKKNPKDVFLVTQIGCGRAGYTPEDIAPLFEPAITVPNIHLPKSFWETLQF